MFRPSTLAVTQLNKIRARSVTKGELIKKLEHAGFTDLDTAVPLEVIKDLREGLLDSPYHDSNPSLWVCTDD